MVRGSGGILLALIFAPESVKVRGVTAFSAALVAVP